VVSAIESRGVGERLRITVRRGEDELTLEVTPVDLSTLQPA
jgi:S1-C subfamily serine protease